MSVCLPSLNDRNQGLYILYGSKANKNKQQILKIWQNSSDRGGPYLTSAGGLAVPPVVTFVQVGGGPVLGSSGIKSSF